MKDTHETETAVKGPFPKELVDFFEKEGPKLLLVRGKARAGKTTLVLTLAEVLATPMNSFLICTREHSQSMYEAFPWLRVNEERDKALEKPVEAPPQAERPPLPEKKGEEEAKIKSARDILKSILGEVPGGPESPLPAPAPAPAAPGPREQAVASVLSHLKNVLGGREPPELIRAYNGLATAAGVRTLVAMDRADRFCDKYGLEMGPLATELKADLTGRRNAHLVLVLEKASPALDALADGIVALKEISQGEDFLGQMELLKLGKATDYPAKVMYNLKGGRFQVLKGMRSLA